VTAISLAAPAAIGQVSLIPSIRENAQDANTAAQQLRSDATASQRGIGNKPPGRTTSESRRAKCEIGGRT
jgi:hypothetical protein